MIAIFFGIIGFAIGRAISLVFSQLFQQHVCLNLQAAKTLIVLGSGGHTTEILEIVKKLKTDKYTPRSYVVAENDENSVKKVLEVENKTEDQLKLYRITRSRKVHQSYLSSIFTTLRSTLDCLKLMIIERPNLVLCNGPATCVPVCLVAFIFKVFYINKNCKIAFIESYCRVKSLSLSGWILLYLSDIFVVQWPQISKISRKILYFGRLT